MCVCLCVCVSENSAKAAPLILQNPIFHLQTVAFSPLVELDIKNALGE